MNDYILGSLLFCPDCGTLLDLPKDNQNEITCEQCGHVEPANCASCFLFYLAVFACC